MLGCRQVNDLVNCADFIVLDIVVHLICSLNMIQYVITFFRLGL